MRRWNVFLILAFASVIWAAVGCRGDKVGDSGPVCGDGVMEGQEQCDGVDLGGQDCAALNLGDGDLTCNDDCTLDVSGCSVQAQCGNGIVEFPEQCDATNLADTSCTDLGFDSGTLTCGADCNFDTTACVIETECGDGVRQGAEECDGDDLGQASCESLGLGEGALGCSDDCTYDVSSCSIQPECGNGVQEPGEVCDGTDLAGQTCQDEGFYDGTLTCLADCSGVETSGCSGTCGDGIVNGPETCDGSALAGQTCQDEGFYGGTLGCAADCSDYDTAQCEGTCGDNEINGAEVCDGADLGDQTCQDVGYYSGTLGCAADCSGFDVSQCVGTCGDNEINGNEVCDGDALNGQTCQDAGYDGGTLACGDDCMGFDTSGCILDETVLIAEISLGSPDGVELINVSDSDVDLAGWSLEWWGVDSGTNQIDGGVIVLPPFVLAPGERVFVRDEYPGNQDPPEVINGEIHTHVNIWWYECPGSATLFDPNDVVADFARWGGTDFDPPQPSQWEDTPEMLPSFSSNQWTLSRVPEDTDTNTAGDFCLADETLGDANGACLQIPDPGALLINEIQVAGTVDRIELYNPGNSDITLDNLAIYWTSGYNNGDDGVHPLPVHTLAGGQYLVVEDNLQFNQDPFVDGTGVGHIRNINWADSYEGSCSIVSPLGGIDFVRWGDSATEAIAPDAWSDNPDPLPLIQGFDSLARDAAAGGDTNEAADWCLQGDTMGDTNETCP